MKRKSAAKLLAGMLTAFMFVQSSGLQYVAAEEPVVVSEQQTEHAAPVLQSAAALIPSGSDAATVKEILGNALVANADEVDLQSLEWEYYCTGKNGLLTNDAWGSVNGFTSEKKIVFVPTTFTHPALADNSDGDYQVRLAGTDTAVTLTKKAKLDSGIVLRPGCSVKLTYNDDLSVNYDALRSDIFNTVVESVTPELTAADVTIEYYATAKTGSVGNLGKAWAPLEGGTISALNYPAISAGTQKIRITYAGTDTYTSASAETEITIADRPEIQFTLKEGPYTANLVFNDDQTYNYEASADALYHAVIESVVPELSSSDITVEYNAALTDLVDNYQPLDNNDWSNLKKFGPGEWEIRFSWNGNTEYRGGSVTADVNVTDGREPSSIAYKDGAVITYNVDASVMKQAILNQAIDWENSVLPDKSTVTADDFTMEYYGNSILPGNISGPKGWAPVEGQDGALTDYPVMGAGEQKIRIAYNGDAQYRPSDKAEGTVSVNKAKVKVSVKSTNIFADEALPEGFITTDPADSFDLYTIYAGSTSDVSLGIYLDLPERFTDNAVLKLLDPVVKAVFGKTFTEMMNDGMTVGELRELFSTQELLDLLDKLNIDTGTFGEILKIVNSLPSIIDSVRVSFGTPNRAGLYTVTAVSDNPNYKTGVGIGMLLVKMRAVGVKLTWNQAIPNGKISAADAAEFDFRATLSNNGDASISQSNVHYLYSGFTSKWRIYSSTTTPPSEPGAYVMTVVTLGGNYLAAPITRAFTIY